MDGKYLGPAGNFKVAQTYELPAGEHELKLVDPLTGLMNRRAFLASFQNEIARSRTQLLRTTRHLYISGYARRCSSAASIAVPIWISGPLPIPGQ